MGFPWTPEQKARVLGGGVSKWGCSGFCPFPDKPGGKFDSMVWPVSCAVAERLWSAANVTDVRAAEPRIKAQRDRLVQRGVAAGRL